MPAHRIVARRVHDHARGQHPFTRLGILRRAPCEICVCGLCSCLMYNEPLWRSTLASSLGISY
eukprot:scaffold1727_cov119-Isochrysis_galbana.AAC.5